MVLLQSSGQDKTAVGLAYPQAALSNRGPSTEWGSGSDSRLGAGIGRGAPNISHISGRLRLDFPEDPTMRISHEAIYQALLP